MDDSAYPDVRVEPYSNFNPGKLGYVITQKTHLVGLDGPIYGWPVSWAAAPERSGVFATIEEAERVLAKRLH